MTSVSIARSEIARVTSNRFVRMALVVVMLVPLLYGALYLWAFWDPYTQLNRLPVALVNQDVPATANGKPLHAGADLTKKLLDGKVLGWKEVSAEKARAGVADGTYYASLTIPADFSKDLATASGKSPVAARLRVTRHESSNVLASQIEERVFSQVRAAMAETTSRSYLDNILLGVSSVHGKLTDAYLGAHDLAAGIAEARDGAAKLDRGAAKAAAGSADLSAGIGRLATGAVSARDGAAALDQGAQKLAGGLASIDTGAASLASANGQIAAGNAQLSDGLGKLATGADAASSGAAGVAGGAAKIDSAVTTLGGKLAGAASGASATATGASTVLTALRAYAAAHPEATKDPSFGLALVAAGRTSAGASALADGLTAGSAQATALSTGTHQLADGAARTSVGVAQVAAGLDTAKTSADLLAAGSTKSADGARTLSAGVGTAYAGSTRLQAGAHALANGTTALAGGAATASSGARTLTTGLTTLSSGTHSLATGLAPAVSGSRELANGLKAGADAAPKYTAAERATSAEMMADPVRLTTNRIDPVPNYGTGFTPYFIPLALWVGSLISFFILAPIPEKGVREGRNPLSAALGGFWPAGLLAVAQSAILVFVLIHALGLAPVNTAALYLFTALVALTFTAVVQWASAMFGTPGKMVAIILLMLQLTSAAGTFPLETLPTFFKVINPYLPMTYAVSGLREAVSGGNMAVLLHNSLVLAAFAVASLALTSVAARMARNWSSERLSPSLQF